MKDTQILIAVIIIIYLYVMPMCGMWKAYTFLNGKLKPYEAFFSIVPIINLFWSMVMYGMPEQYIEDPDYYDCGTIYCDPKKRLPLDYVKAFNEHIAFYVPIINICRPIGYFISKHGLLTMKSSKKKDVNNFK